MLVSLELECSGRLYRSCDGIRDGKAFELLAGHPPVQDKISVKEDIVIALLFVLGILIVATAAVILCVDLSPWRKTVERVALPAYIVAAILCLGAVMAVVFTRGHCPTILRFAKWPAIIFAAAAVAELQGKRTREDRKKPRQSRRDNPWMG